MLIMNKVELTVEFSFKLMYKKIKLHFINKINKKIVELIFYLREFTFERKDVYVCVDYPGDRF